jgi:hypothetical protein
MSGGQQFEAETASCLKALGWNTLLTAVTGDWGADVVGRIGDECLVVQCKDWGNPAGLTAVQEVAFARIHYKAQLAAVVSRNGYTSAAKKAATASGVHLLGLEDLYVGSSVLDRSKQGARLREGERRRRIQEADIEYEKRASLIWHRFDRTVAMRRRIRPCLKVLAVTMIVVGTIGLGSFAAISMTANLDAQEIISWIAYSAATIAVGTWLKSERAYPPPKIPNESRRSARRHCPNCMQQLRLNFGRSGMVLCPRCKFLFHCTTMWTGASTGQSENSFENRDESFLP